MSLPSLWIAKLPEGGLVRADEDLGHEERERLLRIENPRRRRQFLFTRQLLRKAVEAECGIPSSQQGYTAVAGETPRPLDPKSTLQISLSHSGPMAACLIAEEPCGLDIEDGSTERDFASMARAAFKAEQQDHFFKNPTKECFYLLWTEHEARFKAKENCKFLGRMSLNRYRLAFALRLTGIQNLVIL